MNKNQKRSITRRYNARLFKVLEITRQKPLFPTEILRMIFGFAKSMAIGAKMIEVETTLGKTAMHNAILTIRSVQEIDEDILLDDFNMHLLRRVVAFAVTIEWPLCKEDQEEYDIITECVQKTFVDGSPPMFQLILQRRIEMNPYEPENYTREKWGM